MTRNRRYSFVYEKDLQMGTMYYSNALHAFIVPMHFNDTAYSPQGRTVYLTSNGSLYAAPLSGYYSGPELNIAMFVETTEQERIQLQPLFSAVIANLLPLMTVEWRNNNLGREYNLTRHMLPKNIATAVEALINAPMLENKGYLPLTQKRSLSAADRVTRFFNSVLRENYRENMDIKIHDDVISEHGSGYVICHRNFYLHTEAAAPCVSAAMQTLQATAAKFNQNHPRPLHISYMKVDVTNDTRIPMQANMYMFVRELKRNNVPYELRRDLCTTLDGERVVVREHLILHLATDSQLKHLYNAIKTVQAVDKSKRASVLK